MEPLLTPIRFTPALKIPPAEPTKLLPPQRSSRCIMRSHDGVGERRRQLNQSSARRSQSTERVIVDTGLVSQLKQKLLVH